MESFREHNPVISLVPEHWARPPRTGGVRILFEFAELDGSSLPGCNGRYPLSIFFIELWVYYLPVTAVPTVRASISFGLLFEMCSTLCIYALLCVYGFYFNMGLFSFNKFRVFVVVNCFDVTLVNLYYF